LWIHLIRRYGLIGDNGSGKTTFLRAIAAREIDIPAHVDIYHLNGEVAPSDMTAEEVVIELGKMEQIKLEQVELLALLFLFSLLVLLSYALGCRGACRDCWR
jgi:ATPase subunit of ABC transporter with duplicated ATPase domains